MDRRNGGTSLAPPRPPKSLPRVHRPRAPDPNCSSSPSASAILSASLPTAPNQHTFARRRLSPVMTSPHHPHLTSIPLGSTATADPTAVAIVAGALPPALLLPVDQPIVGGGVTAPNSPSNPTTPVTLAAPRPENERLANEYVDTPFGRGNGPAAIISGSADIPSTGPLAGLLQQGTHQQQQQQQQHRNLSLLADDAVVPVPVITGQPRSTLDRSRSPIGGNSDAIRVVKNTEGCHGFTATTTTITPGNGHTNTGGIARGSSIITKQPTKKKDGSDRHELLELELQGHHHHHHHHRHHGRSAVATVGGASPAALGPAGVAGSDGLMGIGSITCPRCRRCRCEECQKPRPLPSHWLCDKS
uniref:Uncharacterized protein n=1 Tax=Anopheles maculatus TaxID=74869 RepID=A0A182SN19_9DIPT